MTARPVTWQGIPIPYGASLDALQAAIDGPPPGRWAAFRALEAAPGTEALHALVQYARSPDPHVRRAAVEGIGGHSEGQQAATSVCGALRDTDQFVVRTGCGAAATLGLSEAHDLLRALLSHSSAETRRAAVAALVPLWRDADYSAVLFLFTSDETDEVRKQAAWTLRAHVTSNNWMELFSLWSEAALPRYRTWSCELAEAHGTVDLVPRLEALSHDSNGHVRSAAERALHRIAKAG